MKRKPQPEEKADNTSFPLRMPKTLDERMSDGAKKTGLSKSDFMRLSMERGAELLIKALNLTPEQLASIPDGADPVPVAA